VRRRLLWPLALPLTLVTCTATPPPAAPDAEPVLEIEAPQPPLLSHGALAFLPRDTEIVVVGRDLAALALELDYDRLRAKHAEVFQPASDESRDETGEDLLSLEGLRAIGLAPDRPWGFAWLDSEDEAFAAFAEVADEAALRAWFRRFGELQELEMVEDQSGDAVVLHPAEDGDLAVVLLGGYAFFVGGPYRRDVLSRHLERLHAGPTALESDPRFRSLREHEPTGDVAAFINVPSILERLGSPRMLTRAVPLFGGIDGVVLSAALEDRRVGLRGFVGLHAGSLLARGVRAGGVPALFTADLDDAVVGAAHLEATELGSWFDAVMSLDGDPARAREELRRDLGVDFDSELWPALSGDIAFAYQRLPPSADDEWPRSTFTLSLGVTTPEQGKRLAARLDAGLPERVRVGVVGDDLVMTEHAELLRALPPHGAPNVPDGLAHPEALFGGAPAAVLRVDATILAGELFGLGYYDYGHIAAPTRDERPLDPREGPEARSIRSRIRTLQADLDEAYASLAVLSTKRAEVRARGKRSLADALGTMFIAVRPTPSGLELEGGQYLREPDAATLLGRIFEIETDMERQVANVDRASEPLEERVSRLSSELNDAYRALDEAIAARR
jgi:hypothetical protein